MPGNPGYLDPRNYVVIKPLSISSQKGVKIQARSPTLFKCWEPSREEVFEAHYHRRQKQLTQQGYYCPNYTPYEDLGHPLFLEAKKLILHSLGQDESDSKPDVSISENEVGEETTEDLSSKISGPRAPVSSLSSLYLKHRRRDSSCFNKQMQHTKQLVSNVRRGKGYFHLLHAEEEAKKLDQQAKEQQQKEKRRTEPRPFMEEECSQDQEVTCKQTNKTRFFLTEVSEQKKKENKVIRRPFTPIHNSLFSDEVLNEDPEFLFRQLCALHWLLESLIMEPNLSMRPVSSCWSIRDPGSSKTSLKRINREKEVEVKWEQFIMPGKSKKSSQKLFRSHFLRPRKASFLSISRFSGVSSTQTPTIGSVSSLIPSSEEMPLVGNISSDALQEGVEDLELAAQSSLQNQGKLGKEEDEEPVSDYMQKLLEMIAESVNKELDEEEIHKKHIMTRDQSSDIREPSVTEEQGSLKANTQRPKSSPSTSMSPTGLLIKRKQSTFTELREMFFEVADEADMYLHDKVEAIERMRHELSVQKYRSLDTISHFHKDLEKMRKTYCNLKEEKDYTDTNNWFVVLLSRISPTMKKNQKIQHILSKLQKLEEKHFVRIRPNAFLKVLGGLCTWELCAPDISVAIEFVREYLVQMPTEDYEAWLNSRINSSPTARVQSAPPLR
ncbi:coiled-coil domain-containing protein 60 [Spea bombifrons]|uniref:coiled-coil domain-containing protein 60 n=1 Tax=Spea bombifrons TaxID=233779 RepID=UPI00234A9E51|nr:coiled-coil domain-containing protein 60 [Spea bombifrons]